MRHWVKNYCFPLSSGRRNFAIRSLASHKTLKDIFEITVICSGNHTKYRNTTCGKKVELFNSLCDVWTELQFEPPNTLKCRSQWPRVLRRCSAATRLLRMWVRIPRGAWLSVVSVVYCQVEVSGPRWSLIQRSPADCGASFCVWSRKPREWGGPGPLGGFRQKNLRVQLGSTRVLQPEMVSPGRHKQPER